MFLDEEDWAAFAEEAGTAIREIETCLLVFERRPATIEEIHSLYRGLHTLKGTSAFLDLNAFGHVAHACEDLVGLVRDHGLPMDEEMVGLLLEALDVLQSGVEQLLVDHRDLAADVVAPFVDRVSTAFLERGGSFRPAPTGPDGGDAFFDALPPQPVHEDASPVGPAPPSVAPLANVERVDVAAAQARALDVAVTENDASTPTAAARPPGEEAVAAPQEARTQFLRIDGSKVSALMDLAGELGLACSAVTRHKEIQGLDLEGFAAASHRLELLVRSIQTDLSALRLVPIAPLFQRMQRIVRDAARRTGKDVVLDVRGEDTEVDKVMLDVIQDPLIHVLRNAVDHGIEAAEIRARLGKPAQGHVTLSATHQGGEVTIEVRDDGQGVDRRRVLARAKERGLCKQDAVPTDAETIDFLFAPGFSTKDKADELSGRGVGMDVLKTTIEHLRGHVRISSKEGAGSRVVMTMPLTLAFVDAMVVREDDRLFALPIEKVFEVVKIEGDRVVTSSADDSIMLRMRDSCVPVVWLHKFWGEDRPVSSSLDGRVVVLVQTLRGAIAVPVDELIGNQQVMLKPLSGVLMGIRAASGCGMLRSGDVAIALDCDKLYA